jgi:hypothetical protein
MMNQFDSLPQFDEMPKIEREWTGEFEKDDGYLKLITKGDKIYSFFKYDRKTNYKDNLGNSLGIFENTRFFSVVHQLVTTLGHLNG